MIHLNYKLFYILLIIAVIANEGFSQGPTCAAASQICGTAPPFPANTTGGTAIGSIPTSVGCLGSTPNESWYLFEVSTAGLIQGNITNSGRSEERRVW